jgi:hypothetical protein
MRRAPFALVTCLSLLLFAPYATAAESTAANTAAGSFVYQPPLRGAPATRVGGGSRGTGTDFVLNVLAPDHTGLTTEAQPKLYWYASGPSIAKIEVTVIAEVADRPLLSKHLKIDSGGVQSFDLAKLGITLKPDTDYEWFVSVVTDPEQRSKDLTSGGTIRRVAPDPAVQTRAAAAGEREAPRIYAQAGLWYDAIDALSRLIERNPKDAELHAERAALLEQVGLPDAAAYDRARSR